MTGHEKIAAKNIEAAFNYIVGGYYNSIQDGWEEDVPETKQDLFDEIYTEAFTNKYGEGYCGCGKAPKEMKFAGTEFCKNYLARLFEEDLDGDLGEIAQAKGWEDELEINKEEKEEEKEMIKAIERKTGNEVAVERLENGKFEVNGKTYAESTFKKYFKLNGETVEKQAPKAKTVEVELYTFTNMKIQGTFEATLVKGEYHVDTKKKGLLKFNAKTLVQTNCKNSKFANRIVIL